MGMLIKPQTDQIDGILRTADITPETAGWQYVSFAVYQLTRGQTLRGAANGRETAVVVLSGTGKAELNGQSVGQIGERLSVFENIHLAVDQVFPNWTPAKKQQHTERFIGMVNLTPARDQRPYKLTALVAPPRVAAEATNRPRSASPLPGGRARSPSVTPP